MVGLGWQAARPSAHPASTTVMPGLYARVSYVGAGIQTYVLKFTQQEL